MAHGANPVSLQRILVWDLPTRVFHWLLVLAFASAYVSGESDRWLVAHVLFGYTLIGLVAFRILWGFAGTRYARFSSFASGPKPLAAYLASLLTPTPSHYLGHNPAAGWMIFALLVLATLVGASGWATLYEIGGRALKELHEGIAQITLTVVGFHVVGVVASSVVHRENLARAMIDGCKTGRPEDGLRGPVWIVGVLLVAAVGGFWTLSLRGDLPGVTQSALEYQKREVERHRRNKKHAEACHPTSICDPSSAKRKTPAAASAAPIDISTDFSAVLRPNSLSVTANVETQGT